MYTAVRTWTYQNRTQVSGKSSGKSLKRTQGPGRGSEKWALNEPVWTRFEPNLFWAGQGRAVAELKFHLKMTECWRPSACTVIHDGRQTASLFSRIDPFCCFCLRKKAKKKYKCTSQQSQYARTQYHVPLPDQLTIRVHISNDSGSWPTLFNLTIFFFSLATPGCEQQSDFGPIPSWCWALSLRTLWWPQTIYREAPLKMLRMLLLGGGVSDHLLHHPSLLTLKIAALL